MPGWRAAQTRPVVISLLAVGLCLRWAGAVRGALMFDESIVWAFAREVRLAPGAIDQLLRNAEHPPLGAWIVRLSAALFGDGNSGARSLNVVIGSATILVVFALGRRLWGDFAGLGAAALLAVDRYHVTWSRLMVEESALLFFGALFLLFLVRAVADALPRDWALAGMALGLAYLSKESAILLVPGALLGLASSSQGRRSLRGAGPALALLAAGLVALPDLWFGLASPHASHFSRNARLWREPLGVTLKASSLYLGELYRSLFGPDVLDVDYAQGLARAELWPVGLAYLVATAWALLRLRDAGSRLLGGVFLCVFVPFTLVSGGRLFDPYWWASLSLVPAILFTARAAATLERTPLVAMLLVLVAVGFDCAVVLKPGEGVPRLTRQEWAERIAADGEGRLAAGDRQTAGEQAEEALLLDAENARARRLLGALDADR